MLDAIHANARKLMRSVAIGTLALGTTAAVAQSQDGALRDLIKKWNLTGDSIETRKWPIPPMDDPMVQLGKALFYTKGMSGSGDTACVTCHHPYFGFGDGLALPIGVTGNDPDLIGPGRKRVNKPGMFPPFGLGDSAMPRNSPTLIGLGFWDESITWDGTVFSETGTPGMSGIDGRLIAPVDGPPVKGMFTMFLMPRQDVIAYEQKFDKGMPLSAGHGMFPASVNAAMRGPNFGAVGAPTTPGMTDLEVRWAVAARIGNYGTGKGHFKKNEWEPLFRKAFKDPSGPVEKLVTPNNISIAMAQFERTMTFTQTPWRSYVKGNDRAISDAAKRGAITFYKNPSEGGAGCARCHSGDFFTDEKYYVLAVPQIGRGKTDINDLEDGIDDWGRAHVTGHRADKYAYRTASLLGVEVTGPWGHTGVFNSLKEVIEHHLDVEGSLSRFDYGKISKEGGPINMRFSKSQTQRALDMLREQRANNLPGVIRDVKLSPTQVDELVAFMNTLTDPCLKDRQCLAKWIPSATDPDPDGMRLCGKDRDGKELLPGSCPAKK